MSPTDRTNSTAPADLTPPRGPDLAPGGAGLPAVVMTVRSRDSHSKSFGSLIRSYGRGKGLSIAAHSNNLPGQGQNAHSPHRVSMLAHLGTHLGVNRGSFTAPHAPSDVLGGGRRG